MAASQCIYACRHGQDYLLKFKLRKNGDLSDYECGMVVSVRWAGLSVSETADLLGFTYITIWSENEKISSERASRSVGENSLLISEVRGEWQTGSS